MLPLRERVGGAGGPPSIRACVRACAQCTRAGVRVSRNACLHADVSKVFLHTLYWMGMDHPAKSTILPAWVRAGRWRPYEGEHAHCTLARTTPCTGPVACCNPGQAPAEAPPSQDPPPCWTCRSCSTVFFRSAAGASPAKRRPSAARGAAVAWDWAWLAWCASLRADCRSFVRCILSV